jgi:Glycosyltransferase family 87
MLAAPASADVEPVRPPSDTEPPRFFEHSAREIERIAGRADKVREERENGRLTSVAYTKGSTRWQVSYFRDGDELVQVLVDDASGAILEEWAGDQVAWTMARGYEGAFGRKLNAPYVWIPLCLLFIAPFVDVRRPFRLLHLDLLVLLAFGLSHIFFNRGEIDLSVPLAYPALLYLLGRLLYAGFRGRSRAGPLIPHVPLLVVALGLAFLVTFRIGLNIADSNVIDVGYAGVIGADRIVDGDSLYGEGFSDDVERGDTYGPVNYLFYVPFEQLLRWSGSWDDLPAAHGAAIAIDLLVIGGLLLLGRRLRPGREGNALGVALAYGWAAYPYSSFVLESNSNDSLVALACVGALLAFTLARRELAGAWSGVAIALGAAAKFVPLALAPLFARRAPLWFGAALVLTLAAVVLPFVPDGGLRELYDRTVGYQAARPSPFSIWGQAESLDWLQLAFKIGTAGLAVLVAFVPRRVDARAVAALGAAVLIALQLTATHWFYLYIVWFVPFVLVALFAEHRALPATQGRAAEPERELVPA